MKKLYLISTLIVAIAFVSNALAGVVINNINYSYNSNLIGFWRLAQKDLKSATVIADLTTNGYDGTITAGAGGFVANHKNQYNEAYNFDGAATQIATTLTSNTVFQNGFTVSVWIKPDTSSASYLRIADKSNGINVASGWALMTKSGKLQFGINTGTSIREFGDVALGQWSHVVAVIQSDAKITCYVNNAVSGTPAQQLNVLSQITTANPLIIGVRGDQAASWFDGSMSDVRVYNYPLSTDEITKLYNDNYDSKIVLHNGENSTKLITNSLSNGQIGFWGLDRDDLKSSTIIADKTTYGHDGTITAGASTGFVADQKGIVGKAYDFDGADTTIPTTLTSNTDFQNGFTVSAWIKPDGIGETAGRILDKSTSTNANDGFSYYIYNSGIIRVIVNNGGAVPSADYAITYGVWQHVLVTVASNALITHYINGVVSGTPATSGALSGITTANALTIGNRSTATDRTFNGSISDVRLYNRVLSASDVLTLYNLTK